jgi:hypothetical protein
MVYNPREDTLRSDTRNGKSLKLGEDWVRVLQYFERKGYIHRRENPGRCLYNQN